MLEKDTLVKVTNRDNGIVGYSIPDLGNLKRDFEYGESKDITVEELRKLSYIPGGMYILKNCLIIDNKDLVEELLGEVEPEYYYTEKEVKDLLLNGSIDEFMDCLDFAPQGTLDLVKRYAVELEINDLAKREAIKEKLNFDVSGAISINKQAAEDNEEKDTTKNRRRVAATKKVETENTERRSSKYKIISEK